MSSKFANLESAVAHDLDEFVLELGDFKVVGNAANQLDQVDVVTANLLR